jgi:hypothetical protein
VGQHRDCDSRPAAPCEAPSFHSMRASTCHASPPGFSDFRASPLWAERRNTKEYFGASPRALTAPTAIRGASNHNHTRGRDAANIRTRHAPPASRAARVTARCRRSPDRHVRGKDRIPWVCSIWPGPEHPPAAPTTAGPTSGKRDAASSFRRRICEGKFARVSPVG